MLSGARRNTFLEANGGRTSRFDEKSFLQLQFFLPIIDSRATRDRKSIYNISSHWTRSSAFLFWTRSSRTKELSWRSRCEMPAFRNITNGRKRRDGDIFVLANTNVPVDHIMMKVRKGIDNLACGILEPRMIRVPSRSSYSPNDAFQLIAWWRHSSISRCQLGDLQRHI